MKQKALSIIFAIVCFTAWGQTAVPLSLISPSGGVVSTTIGGTPVNVEWTLGEVIIGSGTSGSQMLTIGEQQGAISPDAIKDLAWSNLKVYPNPSHGSVRMDNLPDGGNIVILSDIEGRPLQSITTESSAVAISTVGLITGLYLLSIENISGNKISYKISVTNN